MPRNIHIHWESVVVFYGSGGKIPDMVKSLLYGNSHEQEVAYWGLEHLVAPDGALYTGAYYVVQEILTEIDSSGELVSKHEAYAILCWIAQSQGNDKVILIPPRSEPQDLRVTCRDLIWTRSEMYLRDCSESPFPKVRLASVSLLAEYPEYYEQTGPVLIDALLTETDPMIAELLQELLSEQQ